MLALSAALVAAAFVRAFGVTFLGRPRSPVVAGAGEADRFSLATMLLLAALCLLAGIVPGVVIDALAPLSESIVAGRMPLQASVPWLAIVPVTESRSSYDGMLLFAFIALSALISVTAIHRLASRALRRAPAWDCGYRDPSPLTQYSAGSFAQPIRRVFALAFRLRERVEMPAPGDVRAAVLHVAVHDLVWDWLYAPVSGAVNAAAQALNHLQFLTIRRYLSLVFLALVLLLLVLAIWL